MSKWLVRGLVFAAVMVVVRVLQGALINAWDTQAGPISVVLVALFAVAALGWGYVDGRHDARAHSDPDRRQDLAMTWLIAGLIAGVVSGVVAWFVSLFYAGLYIEALLNEITTFAAFTALVVFVFAIVGVALGHWLVDRHAGPVQRRRESDGRHEHPGADVFAAARQPGHDSAETVPVRADDATTTRAHDTDED